MPFLGCLINMKRPHYTYGNYLRAETRLWQGRHVSLFFVVLRRSFCFLALYTDSSQLHTSQINHWRAFWTKYCLVVILTKCKLIKMEHARKKRKKRNRVWWLSPVVGSSHQNQVNKDTLSHVWDLSLNKKTVLTYFFSSRRTSCWKICRAS